MSQATATFMINNFPKGKLIYLNHLGLVGTIAISTGTYAALGLPISFQGKGVYEGIPSYFGQFYSPSSGYTYQFDPVNLTIRIFDGPPTTPTAITAAGNVTFSNHWDNTGSAAVSALSNAVSGSLTMTAAGTPLSNPTVTVAFPTAFAAAPVTVVSRGLDSALTTGYWINADASTTTAHNIYTFVGTPTAADLYVLDYLTVDVTSNPAAAVVAGSFALSSGWGGSGAVTLENSGSTQTAFSINCAASGTTAANPTVTLTFPVPFSTAPIYVCSLGGVPTAGGYWIFKSSTTTTATFQFIGTPTTANTYILDAITLGGAGLALVSTNMTLSSGWGTTATVSASGNQGAFQASVVSQGTGANPTVTLTFPSGSGVPAYVVCRGDANGHAGYWVNNDSATSGTTAVFTFVGTVVAGATYVLNAISQVGAGGTAEIAVGAAIPAAVVGDVIYANVLTSYS